MRLYLFSLAIIFPLFAKAVGDTTWFDKNWVHCDKSEAIYYRPPVKQLGKHYLVKDYYAGTNYLQMEGVFNSADADYAVTYANYYYDNSRPESKLKYKHSKLHGDLVWYYKSGQLKRETKYSRGKLIRGKCYTAQGKDTSFYPAICCPEFPDGGDNAYSKFIEKNMKYPMECWYNHVGGIARMYVYFNENGKVIKVVHKNSLHPDLKKEATRLMFAMPAWQPLADRMVNPNRFSVCYM